LPAPTASEMHIADLIAEDESRRLQDYERAWKAYDGEGPTYLDTDDGHDDNIRLDYPALIVDKGVSFLLGKDGGVTFQPSPPEPAEKAAEGESDSTEDEEGADGVEEAQVARAIAELDTAWLPMRRGLDLHDLATNGGVCGHMWVRIYKTGRVSVLDPANCSAEWDENDVGILRRYFVQWTTADEETGLGVVRRWRIEPNDALKPTSWMIVLEEHDEDANVWRELDTEAWPWSFAPIIEGKNLPSPNTFYGRADLSPVVLTMIEQVESVASEMRRMLRLLGHPVPVVIGQSADQLQMLEVAIGELLAIPDKDAELGQLAVAELSSALELFRELKTALFEGAHVPKVALGETGNAGPTTGVALKVEYEPLAERTGTKHLTYGWVISEIARRLLEVRGLARWTVTLGWPDSTPSDPKADAEADESEIRMGVVSKRTISEKRGYDWEEEQRRIEEETKASVAAAGRAFNQGEIEE
jgi:hypothetical protein